MYIWIAIDVSEQVAALREGAENYVKQHGLASPTLTLPFHISLKISFPIPDDLQEAAVRDIRDACQSIKAFAIPVKALEASGSILWLTMQDSAALAKIHNKLDELFSDKYGVAQHPFDQNFLFHTSVLMMDEEAQIRRALDEMKDASIPHTLDARKIIIGSSKDGRAGTYRVDEEILLS